MFSIMQIHFLIFLIVLLHVMGFLRCLNNLLFGNMCLCLYRKVEHRCSYQLQLTLQKAKSNHRHKFNVWS